MRVGWKSIIYLSIPLRNLSISVGQRQIKKRKKKEITTEPCWATGGAVLKRARQDQKALVGVTVITSFRGVATIIKKHTAVHYLLLFAFFFFHKFFVATRCLI